MSEKWKDILDDYEVSNHGRVRRRYKNGNVRILKGSRNHKGYKYIQIQDHGIRKNYFIHRLVTHAFIGPIHPNKFVNHKDNNITNNNINNLHYVTNLQNAQQKTKYN